jgi:hypothetical protein
MPWPLYPPVRVIGGWVGPRPPTGNIVTIVTELSLVPGNFANIDLKF